MHFRRIAMTVSVAVALSAGVHAEPAKLASRKASEPTAHPAALSSAEAAKAQVAIAASAQAPSKPVRVARVTTCRCGDPALQRDEGEQ